jgi:hypothetical protein
VTYNDLRTVYGWDLGSQRIPGLASTDFYSVICNNFNRVTANRRNCTDDPKSGAGEVHVRYDCVSKTFWVLAYTFNNIPFDTTTVDSMWAVNQCTPKSGANTDPDECSANDNKFLKVSVRLHVILAGLQNALSAWIFKI